MHVSFFHHARDTAPTVLNESWEWYCTHIPAYLAEPARRSVKTAHEAIIFGECDGPRANANIRSVSGLAADIDIGPSDPRYVTFDAMCDRLTDEGYAFIAYTTTANDTVHNRYRLLMPYARPVCAERSRSAWAMCNVKFQGVFDPSTKDPARLSFLPAAWYENPYIDPYKGKVTLAEPFNAIRVNVSGKPVLTVSQIDALEVQTPNGTSATFNVGGGRLTPLTDAELQRLARGHSADSSVWSLLCDLTASPLVTERHRNPPQSSCDRVGKFLSSISCRAVRSQIPISPECLVQLASQFCRDCLNRQTPQDLARRTHDALRFAIRSAGDPPATAPAG